MLPVCSVEEWRQAHRTARKRSDRAERLGYRFACIERQDYLDDIYDVNTSAPERQGRRMSAGYWERPVYGPESWPCERHRIHTYGVLDDKLRAYLWLYRCGELLLVSSILGHAEHLRNDVMYLLFSGAVREHAGEDGCFVYNRADSGTDGLRYFKAKLGFSAMEVTWQP